MKQVNSELDLHKTLLNTKDEMIQAKDEMIADNKSTMEFMRKMAESFQKTAMDKLKIPKEDK